MLNQTEKKIVFFLFLLTNITHANHKCKEALVQRFSLEGLKTPFKQLGYLQMCGGISQSCCTKQDQESIYQRWRAANHKIKSYYDSAVEQLDLLTDAYKL